MRNDSSLTFDERALNQSHMDKIEEFICAGPLTAGEVADVRNKTHRVRCKRTRPDLPAWNEVDATVHRGQVKMNIGQSRAATAACFVQLRVAEDVVSDRVVEQSKAQRCATRPSMVVDDVVRVAVSKLRQNAFPDQALTDCDWQQGRKAMFPCGPEANKREKAQSKSSVPLHRWYSRALFRVAEVVGLNNKTQAAPMYLLDLIHNGDVRVSPPTRLSNTSSRPPITTTDMKFSRDELLYAGDIVVQRQGSAAISAWELDRTYAVPAMLLPS